MERGTLKASAIIIATGETTVVYRTLDEVPPRLRRKLVRSTAGDNAGTVLIADRRGLQELLRTRGKLPGLRSRETAQTAGAPDRRALTLFRLVRGHWTELAFSGALGFLLWLVLSARI